MNLVSRPAELADFAEFYYACFPDDTPRSARRQQVEREWITLLRNPTTLTLLVEDKEQAPGKRIVGGAQAVFVTEQFAALARSGQLSPWINARVTAPLADGSCPLLSPAAVRAANSSDGLIALTTQWMVFWEVLSEEAALYVRGHLYDSFIAYSRGYKLKETLVEVAGERPLREALWAGYEVVHDYATFYREHPPAPPPATHPYLLRVTRAAALAKVGSVVSYAFSYIPPRCFFSAGEQELLCLALRGVEVAELSRILNVTHWTVQKRWQSIFQRVEQNLPGLLPAVASAKQQAGKRGSEKQRVLLQYLHQHMEELRPYLPPRRKPPGKQPK